ncbi:Serine threonine protein kinase-related domain containing protein [Sarcoptes scabiei]|nr:Serine threonine protein kinase-related domain containing protein [Sarcoptes scabiei]
MQSVISYCAVPVSAVNTAEVLQNATIVATSGPLTSPSSNHRQSDEEQLSTTSPISVHRHGHGNSPTNHHTSVKLDNKNHLIVTTASDGSLVTATSTSNSDGTITTTNNNGQTIIVATSQPPQQSQGQGNPNQSNQLTQQNGQSLLHTSSLNNTNSNEVHIKTESIGRSITTILHRNDLHHQQIKNEQQINSQKQSQQNANDSTAVLHTNEVHIKTEPIDSLPPLASPAQMVDVIPANVDHSRELEPSPPATVISLAPAQPYPSNAQTQLTFATPTYDLTANGQYAVQVNANSVPPQYAVSPGTTTARATNGGTVYLTTDYITYREYYPNSSNGTQQPQQQQIIVTNHDQYHTVRQQLANTQSANSNAALNNFTIGTIKTESDSTFLDRYLRQQQLPVTSVSIPGSIVSTTSAPVSCAATAVTVASIPSTNGLPAGFKTATTIHSLTVDLPSPDSGIGGDTSATPRSENAALPQIFEYATGLSGQAPTLMPVVNASSATPTTTDLNPVASVGATPANGVASANPGTVTNVSVAVATTGGVVSTNSPNSNVTPATVKSSSRRSWHEYGRNSDIDKIQIPKLFSDVGFKYFLESPISTSQRREDDRVTYINKGQFYGITLEYITDGEKPLKNATVKSIVMLVFREEKTQDEEVKAWQFWHSRQHSVKQRILDADTKNSSGIVGPIEEVAHNAIAFYWNPLEGQAKVNIAVQCLSTDFSNQKGVKGLPLHLQVDTFDDIREGSTPVHRGYCQIKVFCDKGAERKTRDEERRAAKRKMNATGNGRKKIEEMYHASCDRSEFYSMSDLMKPPVLFTPSEDIDKVITTGDINFYGHTTTDIGYDADASGAIPPINTSLPITTLHTCERNDQLVCDMPIVCPPKKIKLDRYPNLNERVLLYAKQENEEVFHPLHLVPPTLVGLALAIENKYKLEAKNIRNIYKRCKKGITVQMDDDMVKHYSHEDTVLLEVHQIDTETHDITLVEFNPC